MSDQATVSHDELRMNLFEAALILLGAYLGLAGKRLTPTMLVDAWIAGFRAAGIREARRATQGFGRSTRSLPYVIDIPCPFEHRTDDRRGRAHVWFLVEDDGWLSLDAESPCGRCGMVELEKWLLTCLRCEADESSRRHRPGHGLQHSFHPQVGILGSMAPLSFVLDRFNQLYAEAEATAWLEHPGAVVEYLRTLGREIDANGVAWYRTRARRVLGAPSSPKALTAAPTAKPKMTDEEGAAFLDQHEVPASASQETAWDAVKGLPGCPSKRTIERAVNLRKRRVTEA